MKALALVYAIALVMLPLWPTPSWAQAPNRLSPTERTQGWQLLFDGQNIAPWRGYATVCAEESKGTECSRENNAWADKWRVEDHALKLQGSGGSYFQLLLAYLLGRSSADLIYPLQKFSEFELSVDWKISTGGNSGILYYVADEEHRYPWQTGLEMQVLDNDGHSDGKTRNHRAGALYDLQAPRTEPLNNVGTWNNARIKVLDGFIEHWINGKKILRVRYGDKSWRNRVANSKFSSMDDFGRANSGYIVLQDHGDTVWYRNIKLRDLSQAKEAL